MDAVIQFGPKPFVLLGIEAKDWLQFGGALLAALIAVALWFAERSRTERSERRRLTDTTNKYRYAVALSARELGVQLHEINIYVNTVHKNYRLTSSKHASGDNKDGQARSALLQNILNRLGIIYLTPAPILDISVEHARYLTDDQNRLLSEIVSEARSINYQFSMLSTDSVDEAVDTLDVVSEASTRASERVDSLLSLLGYRHDGDV